MLILALVLVTVTSLLLAQALQPLATTEQRLKEAELLYRGQHLAFGIRIFYQRTGRFPFSLEELIEAEPRSIRQLYSDPMSPDGKWQLVYLDGSQTDALRDLNALIKQIREPEQDPPSNENASNPVTPALSPDVGSVFQLHDRQIVGVRSTSPREGFRVFDDSRLYSDWLFTALPKKKKLQTLPLSDLPQFPN